MRKVKLAIWMLSFLLFWISLPVGSSGCVDDTWTATGTEGAPSARTGHTAVWTDTEMIVWGPGNTGGRYDPATDTWTATSLDGAPSARVRHTAVWTGMEMIVWGGFDGGYLNTGGRYDPATDTWTAISTVGAPGGRELHTAVWTGKEMIVWGGCGGEFCSPRFNTGGRYDPATDTWAAISTDGAPSARAFHTAVWTDSEMLVWGGISGPVVNTGGQYDPATDTWTATSLVGAPSPRFEHTAVWTGTEMLVWGGYDGRDSLHAGGRYDSTTDTWAATSLVGAPSPRHSHTAVWTGTEMIVWGGDSVRFPYYLNTGGRYDPATDTWAATSLVGAPSPRHSHTAVWTDSEMLVWGGRSGILLNTGGRYCTSAAIEGPP